MAKYFNIWNNEQGHFGWWMLGVDSFSTLQKLLFQSTKQVWIKQLPIKTHTSSGLENCQFCSNAIRLVGCSLFLSSFHQNVFELSSLGLHIYLTGFTYSLFLPGNGSNWRGATIWCWRCCPKNKYYFTSVYDWKARKSVLKVARGDERSLK